MPTSPITSWEVALETIQATPLCTEFLRIVPGESVVTYAVRK